MASDCRLTETVRELLLHGGELHSEVAVRMPDGNVYRVHRDGTHEVMWKVSDPDAPKIEFNFKDI